jgi:hypothetical protein
MRNPWSPEYVVHVDREGDTERASDGYSRYGSYVEARAYEEFTDKYLGPEAPLEPIGFAITAWRVASPPVMSPGLVDWRPDILKLELGWDEDGKHLVVTAEVPIHHGQLAARIPATYDDWRPYNHWTGDSYHYWTRPAVRPGSPAVTATATIRHIPQIILVQPGRPKGRQLVDDALQSVEHTAAAINRELPEIIRAVQGEGR